MSPETPEQEGKRAAGVEAAQRVQSGTALGLGTGSTVAFFLDALAKRLRDGEVEDIVGVPTSLWTERRASELGIPLTSLASAGSLDLTVDGADEVDPDLNLIKGLGGALIREKMVAQATVHFLIIVDEGKLVQRLGTRSPLPVEVLEFEWETHVSFLEGEGAQPVLRIGEGGMPYRTDNGNIILDCHFPGPAGISDPWALEESLQGRAGVVGSGLFLDMAQEVLVGGVAGVTRRIRNG